MKQWLGRIVYGVLAMPLLYVIWLMARAVLFDYFTVPTSSMTPTILPGGKVIVNKLILGPRIYTDYHFSGNGQQLNAFRLKGFRPLKRNDIIVFNFPLHHDEISFKINHVYCKRIVGLPGDTVGAVHGFLYNNNDSRLLGCREKQVQLQQTKKHVLRRYKVYDVAPYDSHFAWTIQDWGPLYVPRKGDVMRMTPGNAVLYHKVLEWETGKSITWDWDKKRVFAGPKPIKYHRFTHNYYHVCGDYALDSYDSRYWGFVPEEYIVGVVKLVVNVKH